MKAHVFCLLLALLGTVLAGESVEAEKGKDAVQTKAKTDESTRVEDHLVELLEQRADLFFQSMDVDNDKLITPKDMESAAAKLHQHVPGISKEDFLSFIQLADKVLAWRVGPFKAELASNSLDRIDRV